MTASAVFRAGSRVRSRRWVSAESSSPPSFAVESRDLLLSGHDPRLGAGWAAVDRKQSPAPDLLLGEQLLQLGARGILSDGAKN